MGLSWVLPPPDKRPMLYMSECFIWEFLKHRVPEGPLPEKLPYDCSGDGN